MQRVLMNEANLSYYYVAHGRTWWRGTQKHTKCIKNLKRNNNKKVRHKINESVRFLEESHTLRQAAQTTKWAANVVRCKSGAATFMKWKLPLIEIKKCLYVIYACAEALTLRSLAATIGKKENLVMLCWLIERTVGRNLTLSWSYLIYLNKSFATGGYRIEKKSSSLHKTFATDYKFT